DKVVVKVDNKVIPKLIGKNGSMISSIEKKLGIHIDVEPKIPSLGEEVDYELREIGNALEFQFNNRMKGKIASFYINNNFLFSATIGKKGNIKISKETDVGKELFKAILENKKIKVFI
ncbi:MAG: KH domain-containing protein, partial [Candidatus Bathyarchaeia archaeon]